MANPIVKKKASNGAVVKANARAMSKKSTLRYKSSPKTKSKFDIEAEMHVDKIFNAIDEANQIRSGKKQARNFEEL